MDFTESIKHVMKEAHLPEWLFVPLLIIVIIAFILRGLVFLFRYMQDKYDWDPFKIKSLEAKKIRRGKK